MSEKVGADDFFRWCWEDGHLETVDDETGALAVYEALGRDISYERWTDLRRRVESYKPRSFWGYALTCVRGPGSQPSGYAERFRREFGSRDTSARARRFGDE